MMAQLHSSDKSRSRRLEQTNQSANRVLWKLRIDMKIPYQTLLNSLLDLLDLHLAKPLNLQESLPRSTVDRLEQKE